MNAQNISSLLMRIALEGDTAVTADKYKVTIGNPENGYFADFSTMLSSILNIVLTIGVIAVLLYLIWGGIEWITSGGDKGKTESARNKITSAVIGLVILVSAWAILMFVETLLGTNIFRK